MHQTTQRGIFLTIEGIEGVGKTTAVKYIQNYLATKLKNVVYTREPGGTPIAEQIRQILLTPNQEESMASETELLLMFACRAQHIAKLIAPALAAGNWVVSDRFVDATYAYQGGGRGVSVSQIEMLEHWVVGQLQPHVTILLDAPAELGLARAKHRGPHDRIEQEKVDFFERVRAGYLARAKQDAKRFCMIDATQPLETVQSNIQVVLERYLAICCPSK